MCEWLTDRVFPVTLKIIFKIKDACHGRNDAISVISVTNSNSRVHKMRIVKRFDFRHTKAIAHRQSVSSYIKSYI